MDELKPISEMTDPEVDADLAEIYGWPERNLPTDRAAMRRVVRDWVLSLHPGAAITLLPGVEGGFVCNFRLKGSRLKCSQSRGAKSHDAEARAILAAMREEKG